MRADAFLAAAEALPFITLDDLTGGRGLVVVAPHPDDESLGCGGLLAQACARGTAVRLVVVSDGVGSHPGSRAYPPDRLRRLREAETLAAARELGLSSEHVRFLRFPDRYVPSAGPEAERGDHAGRTSLRRRRGPRHMAPRPALRSQGVSRARRACAPEPARRSSVWLSGLGVEPAARR